jgi:sporulation protein YlmC with PRC-barrel domain
MKKKETLLISPTQKSIDEYDSLKENLGKKIFTQSGEYYGRIKDIVFWQDKLLGIISYNKFKRVFIDKSFFITGPKDVQMLSIDPITLLKGKQVFDINGRLIGKVKKINRDDNNNSFKSLEVKKNIFTKSVMIKPDDIYTTKKNILLNKSIE